MIHLLIRIQRALASINLQNMYRTLIHLSWNLFLGVLLSVVVYNLFVFIRYYRYFKFSVGVNPRLAAVPSLPFVGNAYLSLLTGTRVNFMGTLLWTKKHFRLPLNYWYGLKYHYLTNKADEAKIIFNHPKCLNKAELYGDLQHLFGNSLLLVPGEKWKNRRHYLRTAYKYNILKTYLPTFHYQSSNLIKKITSMKKIENLFEFFNQYTFLNFFLTAFGLNADLVNPEIERFGTLVEILQEEFTKLLMNPVMPAFIWMRMPSGIKLRQLNKEARRLVRKLLTIRKEMRDETSEYVENPADMLLVDLLLSENYGVENELDMCKELVLFSAAATETTGHGLAFCCTLLAMHPEIQQRVYDEVVSVVGDHKIEQGNIQQLKYTEAVICESLRLFPSIPLIARYCSEDIDLGTKTFPKGGNVAVDIFHIQRDPAYWPDPLKFDPSRFLPENISKIVPGSYLPFSLGPRNCIGQGLATMLMKLTIANIVKEFKITSGHKSMDEFVLESCISMKTKDPLECHFTLRNNVEH